MNLGGKNPKEFEDSRNTLDDGIFVSIPKENGEPLDISLIFNNIGNIDDPQLNGQLTRLEAYLENLPSQELLQDEKKKIRSLKIELLKTLTGCCEESYQQWEHKIKEPVRLINLALQTEQDSQTKQARFGLGKYTIDILHSIIYPGQDSGFRQLRDIYQAIVKTDESNIDLPESSEGTLETIKEQLLESIIACPEETKTRWIEMIQAIVERIDRLQTREIPSSRFGRLIRTTRMKLGRLF
ncbi:MAG: hypothetical protein ABH856_02870 [Patescibacteria group bacterium]|nr:hypothetical protein [Patescibacteria group bacterium]